MPHSAILSSEKGRETAGNATHLYLDKFNQGSLDHMVMIYLGFLEIFRQ